MTKTADQHFVDWEGHVFGFGYGSGEEHVLPALKTFLGAMDAEGRYDYRAIEAVLNPTIAWLLINALCHDGAIEYGSSPRFGWLTPKGVALKAYVTSKTAEELVEIITDRDMDDVPCFPDGCNCGPDGYKAGRVCGNPFFGQPAVELTPP